MSWLFIDGIVLSINGSAMVHRQGTQCLGNVTGCCWLAFIQVLVSVTDTLSEGDTCLLKLCQLALWQSTWTQCTISTHE